MTKQKEIETEKRKLSEGEMGRLVRGKNMLTNMGRTIAKVVHEGAEQDIKRVEQVASIKVCPVDVSRTRCPHPHTPYHYHHPYTLPPSTHIRTCCSHHPTTTTITTLPLRRQI